MLLPRTIDDGGGLSSLSPQTEGQRSYMLSLPTSLQCQLTTDNTTPSPTIISTPGPTAQHSTAPRTAMARKGEDLLKDLDDLGVEDQPSSSQAPATTSSSHKKSASSSKSTPKASTSAKKDADNDENLFGDIEKQLASKPAQQSSRPATPRVSSSSTSAATSQPAQKYTPASSNGPSARTSEEKGREAVEQVKSEDPLAGAAAAVGGGGGGGGWWGMVSGAASAARKQAESLAKQVQGNEEAQRWAAQVQGRLGGLQHLGRWTLVFGVWSEGRKGGGYGVEMGI